MRAVHSSFLPRTEPLDSNLNEEQFDQGNKENAGWMELYATQDSTKSLLTKVIK